MRDADQLVRLTLSSQGDVRIGRDHPGRGAWICPDQTCVADATRSRGFSRAFRSKLSDPDIADTLTRWLRSQRR